MTTPIKIKRSGTASSTPSSLDHGELAINYADDTLFWKDSSNVIQSFVFQAYASATHASTHATGGSDALSPSDIGAAPAASPAITGNATFEASSGVPVTITNTGTGNSFVVNDASGDTTPFVIDSSGQVGIGTDTSALTNRLHVAGTVVAQQNFIDHFTGFTIRETGNNGSNASSIDWVFANGLLGAEPQGRLKVERQGTGAVFHAVVTLQSAGANVITEAMRITPTSTFVGTGSGSSPNIVAGLGFVNDQNTGIAQLGGADTWSVVTAGQERVRVTSSGTVGIGTASIDSGVTLDTRGTIQAKAAGVKIQAVDSSVIVKAQASNATSEGIVGTESNHNLAIRANNVAALRVKTTGAVRFVPLSADPASGEAGDVYYNSSTNKLRVYNGTSWIDLH